MIQKRTLTFLKNLNTNNNKVWFDENRDTYQEAKADFEVLTDGIKQSLCSLEPALADQKSKDCIFRIFRDVRFSKDKTPYKSHFGAYFSKGGRKFPGAGYYLHIEPGKSMAAGGLWMPEPALLKAVRQEIDYNFEELQGIINHKDFLQLFHGIEGEQLKSVPQGYDKDNPAADYLRYKSLTVSHMFKDTEVMNKDFTENCRQVFAAMKPLVDFLNRALD